MSANIFLNSSIKFIPQMDISVQYTENGGIEASQTFLARKADLDKSRPNLALFTRGRRWEELYPEVPPIYRELTMKTFDPQDHQPGIVAIKGTFTGYQWSFNGSSGDETEVPTTSLRGNLQDGPLTESKAWQDLDDGPKERLGWLINNPAVSFSITQGRYGKLDDDDPDNFIPFPDTYGFWPTPTGDELIFAKMIIQGKTTCPLPSWNYVYRTESKTGFTAAQLNTLNKIVATPQGSPIKPSSSWTWLLVGPEQSQSGPDRFVKELTYQLIPNTDENQMLHRP